MLYSYFLVGVVMRFFLLSVFFFGFQAFAFQEDPEVQSMVDSYLNALEWQHGDIALGHGLATMRLDENYRFLGKEDTETVLVDLWGNPPGTDALGMIFPIDQDPISSAYGIIVSYEEDGFVEDDEAASIDYDDLLKDMIASNRTMNKQREEAGYGRLDLITWAEAPHYDSRSKKLYWAKHLRDDADVEYLNYDVRILGRKGVLVMQAVAGLEALPEVKPAMEQVLGMTDFNPGNRYVDFNPKIDRVAAYGIGGLIAGKLAAKTGVIAGLFKLLLAAKKFLLFAVIGIVAVFKKFFGRGDEAEPTT